MDDFDEQKYGYQLVDDLSQKEQANSDASQMAKVYGGIQSLLDKPIKKQKSNKDTSSSFVEESKDDSSQSFGQEKGTKWTNAKKDELKNQLGDKIFLHYYDMIY